MAYDIGPRIGIEGDKVFKDAIYEIGLNVKILGGEMKKVTAEFADNADSMDALTAKSNVYNKQVDEQKKFIDKLKDAIANASNVYGENSVQVKNWQIKLNDAEAELSILNSSLNKNQAALDTAGIAFEDNSNKTINNTAATGRYHDILTKVSEVTGVKIPAGLDKFAVGAAAASAIVAVAFKAIESAVTTVQEGIETASADMKELARTANEAQLGDQQMAALDYAAKISNTTSNALIDGFTKTLELIGKVEEGNDDAISKFAVLGISIRDEYTGELKTAEDVFFEIAEKLGNIEDTTKRNSTATNLFGGEVKTLFGVFEDGAKTLKESVNSALDDGIVKSQAYYDRLLKIAQETDKMSAQLNTLKSDAAVAWTEIWSGVDGYFNMDNWLAFMGQFGFDWQKKIMLKMGIGADYDIIEDKPRATNGSGFQAATQSEEDNRWEAYQNLIKDSQDETTNAVDKFAEQNSANLNRVGDALTEAQKKAAEDMSEAVRNAQIDANDSVQDATLKIAKELSDMAQIERTTAEATKSMEKILQRNNLSTYDSKSGKLMNTGDGYIDFGDGNIVNVGKNAKGTDFFPGGLTWINEEARTKGPELVNLPRGSQIYSADDTKEMLGGKTINNQATINIYQPVQSPYAVAKETKKAMKNLIYGM